ncbi:phage antirepressor N-terminal domain-containing protein [Pseudomonas aeruginosa]
MSAAQLDFAKVVPFRNKELLLVDSAGEPFVPMKPVVDGMGLAWQSQHRKLQSGRFATCITEMVIQLPGDIQRRPVSCLPLRKLTGWLMSIHPNKVRPELREGIIAYQNECDDALWAYWNDGIAVRQDDRSAASVLSTTIGTDGFHILGALIKGKVATLPVEIRRRATMKIWSQTHAAFGVRSASDIPANQLDSARNFVAAYSVHEGEWLPKPEKRCGTMLNDHQLYDVYFVCHHFQYLYEIFKRHSLYNFLGRHGSRAGVEMIDHFKDGYMGVWKLRKDFNVEFDAVQRRLRLNQYSEHSIR